MMNHPELTVKVLTVIAATHLSLLQMGCKDISSSRDLLPKQIPMVDKTITNTQSIWEPTKPEIVYVGTDGSEASIIRFEDGTLLALVEAARGEGKTQTTMYFIESTDSAQTWSNPFAYQFPLAPAGGVLGLMNDGRAFMVCTQSVKSNEEGQVPLPETENYESKLPDGRLILAYRNYRIRTSMWITFSSDRGRTWTDPHSVDHGPMRGAWTWPGSRPFQLADGTIVIPIAGYLSMDDMDGIWLSSGVLRSTDNAKTWRFVAVGRADRNEGLIFSEPAMALLQDNHLLIMMRTEGRVLEKDPRYEDLYGLYHSISADGGKTWTSPFRAMEGTHCSIVQIGDGNILCGHHLATRRDGKVLSVADPVRFSLSADAGRTWSTPRPWFTGRENLTGWYTNVEYVDENTAVAMIRDSPQNNRLWACRLLRKR